MKTRLCLTAALLAAVSIAQGQVSITATGVPVTVDFTGFAGTGFNPSPSAGQLDGDDWASTGLSDGDRTFGDVDTTGDYARGTTTGGVFSGGFYALDNGGDISLMVQPTGSDWSPGDLTLRLQNNTGGSVGQLDIAYDLVIINNEGRANSYNFSYSTDDVTYTSVAALDYTSPEASDTLGVAIINQSSTLTSLGVIDGGFIYLRWSGDDVTGGGSRDEFGLDNISATATAGGTISAFNFSASDIDVNEGDGSVNVSVDLSTAADCDVDVVITGGSATNGADYSLAPSTTLNFTAAGATSQSVSILLGDDSELEMEEDITLELQNATATCILGAATVASVNIEDNESAAFGECANLYFSEYIEGSGNNKALEIYNPTGGPIDLSGYTVVAFNNGGTTPTNTEALSGTLAAGDVYVIANSNADSVVLAQADITSTVTFYNGDDAIVLFNGGDTIDAIGEVGFDPGSVWSVDTGATGEFTLVRKAPIKQGQKNWAIGATEWDVYAQNTFDFLGAHTQDACAVTCNSAIVPTNQAHVQLSNRFRLTWDETPGAVACQVQGQRLVPPGPSPRVNILSPPFNTADVPFNAIGAGTTWTWRVRCACNVSPVDASAYSIYGDTFVTPTPRQADLADLGATLFPNPASDQVVLAFQAENTAQAVIDVVDLTGRTAMVSSLNAQAGMNRIELNVSALAPGMYLVRVDGRLAGNLTVNR